MGIKIKILSLIVGILFFVFISLGLRKYVFRPSYVLLWFLISFFLFSIPVFEPFYTWFNYSVLGLTDARNIIYIALIGFLLINVFYLTIKISLMSDQIQELISFTSILKNKIDNNDKPVPDRRIVD